jgi:hypothetical protein
MFPHLSTDNRAHVSAHDICCGTRCDLSRHIKQLCSDIVCRNICALVRTGLYIDNLYSASIGSKISSHTNDCRFFHSVRLLTPPFFPSLKHLCPDTVHGHQWVSITTIFHEHWIQRGHGFTLPRLITISSYRTFLNEPKIHNSRFYSFGRQEECTFYFGKYSM